MSRRSGYGFQRSSSMSSEAHSTATVTCRCGFQLPLITSWTPDNPGKRYHACPNYGKSGFCGVFQWVDLEICSRSKMIIPGLLRKLNKLEGEVASYKEKEAALEKERKSNNKKAKKLDKLIAMYNRRMKLQFVVLAFIVFFVAIFVMKMTIGTERVAYMQLQA